MSSDVRCPRCSSGNVFRNGKADVIDNGEHIIKQRYKCKDCKRDFTYGAYDSEYFEHFGVKLKVTERNKISRELFSAPDDRISSGQRKYLQEWVNRGLIEIPGEIFKDDRHYTEKYIKQQEADCKKSYDINMKYFNSLDSEDFMKCVARFASRNRMSKVENLNDYDYAQGIYMLVLGDYKQVYIGQSNNIKKRILQHWSKTKSFDRRIFGDVEDSILPIDSFGALDTTEIYYRRVHDFEIHRVEEELVRKMKSEYLLNRTAGGLNEEGDEMLRSIMIVGNARRRKST